MAKSKQSEETKSSELIRDLGRGELDTELTAKIETVVTLMKMEALRTNKEAKGEVKLTLKFTAQLNGEDEVLVGCSYKVDRKEPEPVRRTDVYYVGKGGVLLRERPDPNGPLFAEPKTN